MKLIFLVFCGLFVDFAACEETSNFIVGGSNATVEEFPYMAAIMNFGWPTCGGAIVNSRSILTAAHCVFTSVPGSISAFVGSSRRDGQGGQNLRVARVVMHPDFKQTRIPFFMADDVAIVRTISRISFGRLVQPIPLGRQFVPIGSEVLLTGYGAVRDSMFRERPEQLQQLKLTSISNLRCTLNFRDSMGEGLITNENLCVVADENRGGCAGDSGSPITWRGTVVGVVSWAIFPCGSYPTVFARVHHHLDWIQRNI